jgi:hypothetical protein
MTIEVYFIEIVLKFFDNFILDVITNFQPPFQPAGSRRPFLRDLETREIKNVLEIKLKMLSATGGTVNYFYRVK